MLSVIKKMIKRRAPQVFGLLSIARYRLQHGWGVWEWMPLIWRPLPDRWVVAHQYRIWNGFWPNIDQPRDFTEKLLWLKVNNHDPLQTVCADKIRVRNYVATRCGPDLLVPALLVTENPDDINSDVISANRFIVKTNHDQGGVFICNNRDLFDWTGVRTEIKRRIRRNFYYKMRERQYKDIRPGILVEEMLTGDPEAGLIDYKINCFNGRPEIIQVNIDRFGRHMQLFYDTGWSKLSCWRTYPDISVDAPRPASLDRMLDHAVTLAEPFVFCRVDLYDIAGTVRFGEITFHPGGAIKRFEPAEWERRYGDLLRLPGEATETMAA